MKTINILTLFSVLLFIVIINGCSGSKIKTDKASLDGVEWKLETLNGKAVNLNSGSKITLVFTFTGKFSGTAVCNSYFGEYKQSNETLTFSEIGSTKMMCDDNVDESVYFSALKNADTYTINAGKLTLFDNGNVTAVFNK